MAENVLKKYFRQVRASANLPSRGWWYEEGLIDAKPEAVPVLGYTAADEIMLLTPDKLITGESTYDIIRSCVPSIKDPKKLLKIDIDALMVAIKIATSGNIYTYTCKCPLCTERRNSFVRAKAAELFNKPYENLDSDEKKKVDDIVKAQVDELKAKHEMNVEEQSIEVDARELIAKTDYVEESEREVKLKNGLRIRLKPYKFTDYNEFQTIQFRYEKLQYLLKQREDMKLSDVEINEVNKQTAAVLKNLISSQNILLTGSIEKIITPEGDVVDKREDIDEFVKNIDASVTTEIESSVSKINRKGLPHETEVICPYCGGKFNMKGIIFTESTFFGQSL